VGIAIRTWRVLKLKGSDSGLKYVGKKKKV
jgi:hypothetical protein